MSRSPATRLKPRRPLRLRRPLKPNPRRLRLRTPRRPLRFRSPPTTRLPRPRLLPKPPAAPPARAASAAPAAPTPAAVANAAPPAPPVQQQAAAPATTPFGLWQTDEGTVRVEQCGANLCGYGEKDGKKNDELVLINMRPSSDHSQWSGRIHNPNTGKNYDGTVAMKGPNLLKVQGCIMGGAFCGGTTWKRVS